MKRSPSRGSQDSGPSPPGKKDSELEVILRRRRNKAGEAASGGDVTNMSDEVCKQGGDVRNISYSSAESDDDVKRKTERQKFRIPANI